jgi:hypothetical protein
MSNRKQDGAIRLKKDGWRFSHAIKHGLQWKNAPSGCDQHGALQPLHPQEAGRAYPAASAGNPASRIDGSG